MGGEWMNCTLGDVLTLQRGFDLPAQDRIPGPYPIIASTGEVGSHNENMVRGPGVVIGRSGSLGGGQFITRDFWPLNTTLWVKDFQGNDPRFCFYLLTSIDFGKFNVGGAVPTLNRNHIHPLPVYVPRDVNEQRAIAQILGMLDDKIELNRRMNETLEAIARALFKSWFVDFDPVRAKAEGRDPGLPKPLADLFPDSLESSELGEIPKRWRVAPLDSVLVLQRGFDLPTTQRTSGAYPVLAASGPSGTHNDFMVRGPGVTTGRSGVLGKNFYVTTNFWPLNTSLWVKEFRHSRPAYAFHLLGGLDFALFNAGSAVPTLNRNHVHTLPTLLPPMELIDAFECIATGCLNQQN
jgi:type I restriction enzyme S subunit